MTWKWNLCLWKCRVSRVRTYVETGGSASAGSCRARTTTCSLTLLPSKALQRHSWSEHSSNGHTWVPPPPPGNPNFGKDILHRKGEDVDTRGPSSVQWTHLSPTATSLSPQTNPNFGKDIQERYIHIWRMDILHPSIVQQTHLNPTTLSSE